VDLSYLPALNALLNAVAASLLVWGRRLARARRIAEHRRVMIAAFCVSSLFLVGYVTYKAAKDFENTTFNAAGAAKAAYLLLLASHVTLAMAVPVLAVTLIVLGLRGRFERHRRVARFAWPIWMYVSVTGVVIYLLLYHLNPAPSAAARGHLPRPATGTVRVAATPPSPSEFFEKLSRFKGMRGDRKVEKASGVSYLPSGRPAASRASRAAPPAAPPWAPR
jgi:putative membrane protein